MDCHDVRVLTTVVWPHLTQLELRYSKTPDVQSVSQLANATHLQLQSLDLSYSKIDSCLVAVLLAVPYPNLKSLYLAGNNLTTSMMYLADAHLPLLEELELRNSKLDAQSMAALSRGSWLQLKTLTLADNLIHTPGMQYLAGGNWPPLEAINLSNTGLCGSAMAMLLCGNWPCLQNLGLNGNYMHRMRNLPDFSQYSLLKHLHLNNSDLDHYSLQQLSKARWCQLGTVDLSNNMIESKWACSSFVASHERNPAGWQSTSSTCHSMFVSRGLAFAGALVPLQVTHLLLLLAVCTFLPVSGATVYLRSSSSTIGHLARHWENINFWFSRSLLYLCRLHLDEAALLHLSKGNWPCLKKLDMCNNEQPLSSKAISHLSDAKWPLLEWLCLTNNGFRKAGVLTELSKADWPLLKTLQISLNNFEPEAVSQLVCAHWPLLESLTVSFKFVNDILIKSLIKGKWPVLRELLVCTRTSKSHNLFLGWDKQRLQAWQNVEEDCRQMCRDTWHQLESLELPHAQDISAGF